MKKVTLYLHIVSLMASASFLGILVLFGSPVSHQGSFADWLRWLAPLIAGVAFIAELGEILQRSGRSEGVVLASSTIAAFVLLLLTCGASIAVGAIEV